MNDADIIRENGFEIAEFRGSKYVVKHKDGIEAAKDAIEKMPFEALDVVFRDRHFYTLIEPNDLGVVVETL